MGFKKTLNFIGEVFIKKWWKIITISIPIFLSIPIIRWFILSLKYVLFKTPELADKFAESTIFNLLPWWVDLLTNPVKTIVEFILIIFLVTLIFTFLESND